MKNIITPEFVANFSCIADKCEDHCCHGWNITIDKSTYGFMTKKSDLKEKSLKVIKRTKKEPYFAKIEMNDEGVCPFRAADGLCDVHRLHGHHRLSNTCQSYPRIKKQRGSDIEHSLSLSCPEAARQILFNPNAMNLNTETLLASSVTNSVYQRPNWYPDVKNFFIEMLTYNEIALEERLFLLGITVKELHLHENNGATLRQALEMYVDKIISGELSACYKEKKLSTLDILQSQIHYITSISKNWLQAGAYNSKARAERTKLLHDKLSGVLNEKTEREKAKKMQQGAQGAYATYIDNNPHFWLNFFVYHMYNTDFPARDMLSTYVDMVMDFFIIRGLMMMVAASGSLSNEDVNLIVSLYYRTRQHGKFVHNLLDKSVEQLNADKDMVAFSLIRWC